MHLSGPLMDSEYIIRGHQIRILCFVKRKKKWNERTNERRSPRFAKIQHNKLKRSIHYAK